jgi:hypothetical protein
MEITLETCAEHENTLETSLDNETTPETSVDKETTQETSVDKETTEETSEVLTVYSWPYLQVLKKGLTLQRAKDIGLGYRASYFLETVSALCNMRSESKKFEEMMRTGSVESARDVLMVSSSLLVLGVVSCSSLVSSVVLCSSLLSSVASCSSLVSSVVLVSEWRWS